MKRWISLFLMLVIAMQAMSLTACTLIPTPTPTPDNGECCGNCPCLNGGTCDRDEQPDDSKEEESENPAEDDTDNDDSNNSSSGGNTDTVVQNPGKYDDFYLSEGKVRSALSNALIKVDKMMLTFTGNNFPAHNSTNNVYPAVQNTSGWNQGFWTGMLWHAYEVSGKTKYLTAAMDQIPSYTNRIEKKLGVNTHDMGFVYTPSCVAAYKITGSEEARVAALAAADQLLSRYHEKGQFIQAWGNLGAADNYRLIVDCLMNIPLLYWASEETGDMKYYNAAVNHFNTTITYAYRWDGSTYHTYFFDPATGLPVRGATHQGVSDDSTWARGQAWAMYGPVLTYAYTKDENALAAFKAAASYFLDYLPSDYVPYWDLSYGDGDYEPKDSSAAAIAACALLAGIKYMDESDPLRAKFENAAKRIMNSLIDHYTTRDAKDANGLLLHATYNHNSNMGIDEMNIWGDYFYMEALHRMLDPEWEMYW